LNTAGKAQQLTERLLVVSNRLPVTVNRQDDGQFDYTPSVGGLATSLNALREEMDMLWLGTPGLNVEDSSEQQTLRDELEQKYDSIPLFLDRKDFELYYNGFSNGCLWPLFHYFPQFAHFDEQEWAAYQSVNRIFAERITSIAGPNDSIWVHDYHLLLLPTLLRQALPDASIGFFLHIPFPSYEIFRMLPWREQILSGMIGADLVGFHTYGYARHFLSSLLRILGLEQNFGRVSVGDRIVQVETFPLGIDTERFAHAQDLPAVQTRLRELKDEIGGRKVILSVDRLDFTKGILERLMAYEHFLEEHPEWHDRVSLVSLLVPSRTRVPEYQSLKSQVDEQIGRINGEFGQPGWNPITYLYRSLPFEQLASLYLLADVALVTPLRDGMNLVAKEYLASHTDGSGVLVLSETAGAAAELGEALIVNPHDQEGLVRALDQALSMPVEEQRTRNAPMRARLSRYDINRWTTEFLAQLRGLREARRLQLPRRLQGEHRAELMEAYRSANHRLLLLDYDGTLVPFAQTPGGASPDPELVDLIRQLSSDARNQVVVISGRNASTLEAWLGKTGADLVAEHGARIRRSESADWEPFAENLDGDWKDQLRPLFEVFVDRTPGSLLEEKGAALVWHYRRADPDLGSQRAAELIDALEGFIANTNLHVLQGHKVVEVKPSTVSKGRAAGPWLQAEPPAEFTLVMGDDVTDEAMFEAVPEGSWTVKIGSPEGSHARFFLSSTADVRALLKAMAGIS
jgi:trehalose 6-phosphate synthase/phosphatase